MRCRVILLRPEYLSIVLVIITRFALDRSHLISSPHRQFSFRWCFCGFRTFTTFAFRSFLNFGRHSGGGFLIGTSIILFDVVALWLDPKKVESFYRCEFLDEAASFSVFQNVSSRLRSL
jgi:hypothetical protein